MKKNFILLIIFLAAVSLAGLIFTQLFWLNRSVNLAKSQFDDRADRMLHDIVNELKQFSDTSSVTKHKELDELVFFDVLDTVLLKRLVKKYVDYHRLDTTYAYALVRSEDDRILYTPNNFIPNYESEAYKACLSCIWQKEYIHISVYFPTKNRTIYKHMGSWIVLSGVFLLIIITLFSFIIYSMIRQKKLSEIRNDFINNMTHEFKTPISTISLASEILMKDAEKTHSERVGKYSGIIFEENKRMQSQVELVLQTSLIDKDRIKIKREIKNIHDIIEKASERLGIGNTDKQVEFKLNLQAKNPNLPIDYNHIRNVISNLLDNGIKYSGKNPKITLRTEEKEHGILVSVKDNGIGLSRDSQRRIFDKFYRVSTGDIHDVKGFGLGLYYVKTIVEAHNGSVWVKSALNKGSSFYVFLPRD